MKKFNNHFGNYWLCWGIFFCLIILIATQIPNISLSDSTLIITFIGIIASIIVIGNIAQVYQIKNEFEKKIEELQVKLDKFKQTGTTFKEQIENYSEAEVKNEN